MLGVKSLSCCSAQRSSEDRASAPVSHGAGHDIAPAPAASQIYRVQYDLSCAPHLRLRLVHLESPNDWRPLDDALQYGLVLRGDSFEVRCKILL